MMPPPPPIREQPSLQRPRSLREVPGFLSALCGGWCRRLFYSIRLVRETRRWILPVMTLLSVLNGVLPVVSAYVAAEVINRLAAAYAVPGSVGLAPILWLLGLQFLLLFLRSVLSAVDRMVTRLGTELVIHHIRLQIMRKSQEIDLASFDMPEFYSRLENANREAGMRPLQILDAAFGMFSALLSLIGFIAVLWGISPWAPFLIFVLSVPSAVVNLIFRRRGFRYMRRHSRERRQLSYYSDLMTDKDRVKEIRIFHLADTLTGKYRAVFSLYFTGLRRLYRSEGVWSVLSGMLTVGVNAALMAVVAVGVYRGHWAIGDYSLYTGALNSVISNVALIISATSSIYEGTLFIDNLISFMEETPTVVPRLSPPRHPQRHIGHTIELRDVSFRYPGSEHYVLRHINVSFSAGETVMLVGLNGAGKTTLIKLLTRLYDPTEGVVLLDGEDLRHYELQELYRLFGIIFQDFGKYAVTAGENIAFGDIEREPTPEAVTAAARQGNADAFIRALPQGYETPLTRYFEESGAELSIGQWQKLSVARAFYSDADILILDEPTASLDPLAEQEIYRQFERLREGRTTILVSHRLSGAAIASRILVLENGTVAECGTHRELMARQGRYRELFTAQAEHYREPSPPPRAPGPVTPP